MCVRENACKHMEVCEKVEKVCVGVKERKKNMNSGLMCVMYAKVYRSIYKYI